MPIAQKRLVAAGRWSLAAAAAAAVSSIATPKAAHADVAAVTWGFNYDGQLGNGTDWTTAGFNSGYNNPNPAVVTGLTSGVTAVAAGCDPASPIGDSYCLALVNGGLVAWGYNDDGELGIGHFDNPTPLSSYYPYDYATPVAVTNMSSGVTAVAGGGGQTLAVKNGALYAWGANTYGELGNGNSTSTNKPVLVTGMSSGVTAIAGVANFSLAIQGGAVYAWGYTGLSGVPTLSRTPAAVPVLTTGVTAIAAGQTYGLAIMQGGVYVWGSNSAGLGNGATSSGTPVSVSLLASGVTGIAAGGSHMLALQGGSVYAWGDNTYGQLGNNSSSGSSTPLKVPGITGTITQVAASANDSYALSADGSIWDWGSNQYGQLGQGTGFSTANQTTPLQLKAPNGYAYTSVVSNSAADNVITTLAHPNSVIASSAVGTALPSVFPSAPTLVLSGPTISGSVQIGAGLSNTIYLKLDNTSQDSALVTDLNYVYGAGTASNVSGGAQVALTLPTSGGSPSYFNFDFTTVVNAGTGGNTVGSVAIDEIDFTSAAPEPASLGLLTAAVAGGLFGRRRRARG